MFAVLTGGDAKICVWCRSDRRDWQVVLAPSHIILHHIRHIPNTHHTHIRYTHTYQTCRHTYVSQLDASFYSLNSFNLTQNSIIQPNLKLTISLTRTIFHTPLQTIFHTPSSTHHFVTHYFLNLVLSHIIFVIHHFLPH